MYSNRLVGNPSLGRGRVIVSVVTTTTSGFSSPKFHGYPRVIILMQSENKINQLMTGPNNCPWHLIQGVSTFHGFFGCVNTLELSLHQHQPLLHQLFVDEIINKSISSSTDMIASSPPSWLIGFKQEGLKTGWQKKTKTGGEMKDIFI